MYFVISLREFGLTLFQPTDFLYLTLKTLPLKTKNKKTREESDKDSTQEKTPEHAELIFCDPVAIC